MELIGNTRTRAGLVVAVLATSLAVAACGSSSSSNKASSASPASSTTANGSRFNRAAFQACLKQHGVTLPARPPGSGGPPGGAGGGPPAGGPRGGFFGGGGGGRFANPKFRAAIQACGGGRFRPGARRFRLSHAAITNFVACVRKNGFPQMPNPNFSGGAIFPSNIRTNPKFQTASRACQHLLIPARPGGTGTTAST